LLPLLAHRVIGMKMAASISDLSIAVTPTVSMLYKHNQPSAGHRRKLSR
jgi:hypothetical protein